MTKHFFEQTKKKNAFEIQFKCEFEFEFEFEFDLMRCFHNASKYFYWLVTPCESKCQY